MKNAIQYETGEIENGVTFGTNSKIKVRKVLMRKNCIIGDNVEIYADSLFLDDLVKIESGVIIKVKLCISQKM